MGLLQIYANKEGTTKVHAAIEIENKTIYDSSTVKVIGTQQVTAKGKVQLEKQRISWRHHNYYAFILGR